ncbi:MAG: transglycosylase SLT domain-containing protein [Treponemataceae bacterium]|nr:transglycosylase SLT domain-containing protein [Treponemataceae bacterium]
MIFCSLIFAAAIVVASILPAKKAEPAAPIVRAASETESEVIAEFGHLLEEAGFQADKVTRGDEGLALYRRPSSKTAVEWFYLHVTGDRATSTAILEEAEKNDIPLSLAFALAYTESRYNVLAVNKNKNASIDRGLFQLNNRSFPQLTEEEFFDPAVSAKYGMAHLRFCLNVAGNEVSALAMYNAGTTKVRSNNTPQSTLNYVGKIMAYQEKLDRLFADEVLAYYETSRPMNGVSVAFLNNRRFDR